MMLSLLNLYLATQHFGIAFSSPLRPTTLPHDELTVRAKSAQVQSGDVALVTNLEPVRVGFDDTWSYECLPIENGPTSNCDGIGYWFGNMFNKNSDNFWINLFPDRCWTVQSGVCRLYVCLNGTIHNSQVSVDAHLVNGILGENFQKDCNKAGGNNLAGHAWNADRSVDIYSGIA